MQTLTQRLQRAPVVKPAAATTDPRLWQTVIRVVTLPHDREAIDDPRLIRSNIRFIPCPAWPALGPRACRHADRRKYSLLTHVIGDHLTMPSSVHTGSLSSALDCNAA